MLRCTLWAYFGLWIVQCTIYSAAWLPKSGGSGPKLLVVTQQQRSEDIQSI